MADRISFFQSYYNAIKRIKKKVDRCLAYDVILDYAFYGIVPDLESLPDSVGIAFELVKPNLDASKKKAENGAKGGSAKPSESKVQAEGKQPGSKVQANPKQSASDKDKDKEKEKEKEIYKEIVSFLNQKTGKHFRDNSDKTTSAIHARLEEGFSKEDFFRVIDTKSRDWLGGKMEEYLRPETLFGTKFESYLNAGGNHGKAEDDPGFGTVI